MVEELKTSLSFRSASWAFLLRCFADHKKELCPKQSVPLRPSAPPLHRIPCPFVQKPETQRSVLNPTSLNVPHPLRDQVLSSTSFHFHSCCLQACLCLITLPWIPQQHVLPASPLRSVRIIACNTSHHTCPPPLQGLPACLLQLFCFYTKSVDFAYAD